MTYRNVVATRLGGPEVLEVTEQALREPAPGEARIHVLAASVCRPDITVRRGEALYTGTPLGLKPPFVPGYASIGIVEALGEGVTGVAMGDRVGAFTVTGSYTEVLYWRADRLIAIPAALDPAEAIPLLLNYIVAYQVMHRVAKVAPGDKVLIIGASGGIGTALLQLGKLAGLTMYGLASPAKHEVVAALGATPIDYRSADFAAMIRAAEPGGLDAVFDGMMTPAYARRAYPLLQRGGTLAAYGEPPSRGDLFRLLGRVAWSHLWPGGRRHKLYGTSAYTFNQAPFLEDWATLFCLLEEGQIRPIIAERIPILEAARANALLESGTVTGNLVLVAPELL